MFLLGDEVVWFCGKTFRTARGLSIDLRTHIAEKKKISVKSAPSNTQQKETPTPESHWHELVNQNISVLCIRIEHDFVVCLYKLSAQ